MRPNWRKKKQSTGPICPSNSPLVFVTNRVRWSSYRSLTSSLEAGSRLSEKRFQLYVPVYSSVYSGVSPQLGGRDEVPLTKLGPSNFNTSSNIPSKFVVDSVYPGLAPCLSKAGEVRAGKWTGVNTCRSLHYLPQDLLFYITVKIYNYVLRQLPKLSSSWCIIMLDALLLRHAQMERHLLQSTGGSTFA